MKTMPIANSYWVIPGQCMAGEYPGVLEEEETRRRLRWLLSKGITTWLDLTEAGEPGLQPYEALLREEAGKMGVNARHIRLPIPDFSTPAHDHMQRILDKLDEQLNARQGVYLHCYGGIGRTGMTVSCYLVGQGMSGEAALAQVAAWRKGTPAGWRPSPETEEQCRFVLTWGGHLSGYPTKD